MPRQPAGADYPKMLGTASSWSHGVVKYARAKADSLTDLAVNDSNVFILNTHQKNHGFSVTGTDISYRFL